MSSEKKRRALRANLLAAALALPIAGAWAQTAPPAEEEKVQQEAATDAAAEEESAETQVLAPILVSEEPFLLPPPDFSMFSLADGGMTPMSVIEPPPATNNTLPGLTQYLNDWLLGNDYQACGLLGSGCLTIDRANFNYSYLSLILNLIQAPNVVDLDGNQPANHLTLIGSVHSDSYIQFQDSNYFGNNNNASCVVIGLACTWQTNAAQNNQVIIGDGSYANGSNTVVMGTNARHQLPTVSAADLGFAGGPDTNYAARLGNSVVIGDNTFGNADRQTILGFGATSTHANSVALGAGASTTVGAQTGYIAFGLAAPQTSSGEVSIGSAGATRKLTNVAAASVGTDAVNLAQLQGALATMAADPFAVKYDDLGGSPNLQSVTLQGAGGTTISNVRAGAINPASTQAVNGSQISAISQSAAQRLGAGAGVAPDGTITAPNYVIDGNGYDNVGSALAAIDNGMAEADAFAVQYDDDGAGNPDYGNITLRGPAGTGTVVDNLADGQIAAGSLQAVNGGQIFDMGQSIATAFGGGTVFSGGVLGGTNYVIGGNSYGNVGDALTALDGGLSNSDAFAVQYDDDGSGNPDYGSITLRGPAGTGTTLDNLADGAIASGSLQAVNGGQIFDMGQSVATALGGGTVFSGGVLGGTSYVIGGNSYSNVGDALTALDGSVNGGNAFAVQYDDDGSGNPDYGSVTLRGPAGTGTLLGNVAAGAVTAASLDAVNGSQLFSAQTTIAGIFGGGAGIGAGGGWTPPSYFIQGNNYNNVGDALSALNQGLDDANDRIDNLPPGNVGDPLVAVDGVRDGSDDASVPVGSGSVAIGSGAASGGDHGVAVGGGSFAAGDNDTAIGGNARVSADGSTGVGANVAIGAAATNAVAMGEGASVSAASGTALGQGSSATATNSVALGQGSVADRANTVSVGGAGNTRQVTNVAAGVQSTDAVNVGQLNAGLENAITQSNTYVDNRLDEMRDDIWEIDRGYRAATASALAVAGLPQAYLPGKSMIAMSASGYKQEAALAVGITTISENGRWIYKFSGTTNTVKEVGVTVGAGLQW
ncbi:MAG TPA: YadA-like family protein [Luteimonas sp.]|nr:YadA-like family protein [Luteimonas sp.]